MADDINISLVRRRAPTDLPRHLQVNAQQYGNSYQMLHDVVEAYWHAREEEEEVIAPPDRQPMELDVLVMQKEGGGGRWQEWQRHQRQPIDPCEQRDDDMGTMLCLRHEWALCTRWSPGAAATAVRTGLTVDRG